MSEKSGVTVMTRAQNDTPEPQELQPASIQNNAPQRHVIGDPVCDRLMYPNTYSLTADVDQAPLGMLAYGTVFLCSSLITLGAGGVHTENLVLLFATL